MQNKNKKNFLIQLSLEKNKPGKGKGKDLKESEAEVKPDPDYVSDAKETVKGLLFFLFCIFFCLLFLDKYKYLSS